jgi:hypothetical protein
MDGFDLNRAFEVAAMPAVKAALQMCAGQVWWRASEKTTVTSLRNATAHQDMREATDLKFAVITKGGADVDVAARVRRHRYWRDPRYREQFTIRCKAQFGGRTEIHKVLDGFGTFMLYGFECAAGPDRLVQFVVLDLDVFRDQVAAWVVDGRIPRDRYEKVPNPSDGTAGAAFRLADFPSRLVVCRSNDGRSLMVPPVEFSALVRVSTRQEVLF